MIIITVSVTIIIVINRVDRFSTFWACVCAPDNVLRILCYVYVILLFYV